MTSQIFGSASAPACAQFCLHEIATRNETNADESTIMCILRNMYMDDCFRDDDSIKKYISVAKQLCPLLESGGFHLTKFVNTVITLKFEARSLNLTGH